MRPSVLPPSSCTSCGLTRFLSNGPTPPSLQASSRPSDVAAAGAAAPRTHASASGSSMHPPHSLLLSGPRSHSPRPLSRHRPASLPSVPGPGPASVTGPRVSVSELIEWDVVEYLDVEGGGRRSGAGQCLRLGKVTKVQGSEVEVEPLVEEEEGIWVSDDLCPQAVRVLPDFLIRIVEAELGQRQDRDHNPHGEHCHDIWQVTQQLDPQMYRGKGGEATRNVQAAADDLLNKES